jgi:signal transduction histidine kinase
MSPSASPELSLFQVVQDLEPSLHSSITADGFEGLVNGVMDFLREQAIAATLWLKFPPIPGWSSSVEQYFQAGLAHQIYACGIGHNPRFLNLQSSSQIAGWNTVELEASTQLQREYFLMVISPQICLLLLAQDSSSPKGQEIFSDQPLKICYSFMPQTIETIQKAIKQVITVTDRTPEELITDSVLSFALPNQISPSILTPLLHYLLSSTQTPAISQTHSVTSTEQFNRTAPAQTISQEVFQADDQFLMNVTRELSIPLTNMKTALRLLESMQHKREQRQRYLDLLKRECSRQNAMITGLQELIQLNHPIEDKDITVRVEDCIPGVVSTYQPIAEEKGISLGYTVPTGLPLVACPTYWLRQMLQHLLQNSLKFTPDQGKVYVRANLKGQQIEVSVNDTGMGIEMSDLPKLFNSFYRGRNALTHDIAGVGLGLTIVQQLVKRCGGSVSVTSHVERGSTFRLLLPICPNTEIQSR